jgi:hypothetical protein
MVEVPDEHPQGMGVTGLLKSELFGLSSTLDIETERGCSGATSCS